MSIFPNQSGPRNCLGFQAMYGICIIVISLASRGLIAAEMHAAIAREDLDFFETRIRPVLIQHCYKCHAQPCLA